MSTKTVAIIGGTGFVGTHLCAELSRTRTPTRVLTRRRERHRHLLVHPALELVEAQFDTAEDLARHLEGAEVVINLAGILNETSRARFQFAHAELPARIVEACLHNGIGRLLHMSALHAAPDGPSRYLQSKAHGESSVHAHGDALAVTTFRPSVIFGKQDSFFNRFAGLLSLSPWFFPLACPHAKFAPVFVEDVVAAFLRTMDDPMTYGERFELCGPRQYTLKALVEYAGALTGYRGVIVGLPKGLSRLQAAVLDLVPGKPFSRDNFKSLQVDSICAENGFARLGITPTELEAVVPSYLGNQNPSGRFARFRTQAGR